MAEELYGLFQGDRFQRVKGQTKLRRNGQTVTDIDAAIFDNATGELVLLQLKWQDFSTSIVKAQRSKAKNFVDQVGTWGKRTALWIDQFGVHALCKSLKIKLPTGRTPTAVHMWAIGRSAAHFKSYGYTVGPQVLALSWPQLVRLRHEVGPGVDVFSEITKRAALESDTPLRRAAMPYVLERKGVRVTFKDIWSTFYDEHIHEAVTTKIHSEPPEGMLPT